MRLESTPQRQQAHNDIVHKHLRLAKWLAVALILTAVALEGMLFFNMRPPPSEPTIVGPDGTTSIGFAVPVTPEYVLTNADAPPGSQLSMGSEKLPLSLVRTEKVDGISISLLHLQTPYPKEIVGLRGLQNGESAKANSAFETWEGALTESSPSAPLDAQPGITIGDIASVIAKNDGALLGISAPGAKGDVILGSRDLLAKFPELKK
jgi:hypothetical protein